MKKADAGKRILWGQNVLYMWLKKKKKKKQLLNCGLHKVHSIIFFKGTAVLEILKLGGQYFCFSFKQLMENRNRQATKA